MKLVIEDERIENIGRVHLEDDMDGIAVTVTNAAGKHYICKLRNDGTLFRYGGLSIKSGFHITADEYTTLVAMFN